MHKRDILFDIVDKERKVIDSVHGVKEFRITTMYEHHITRTESEHLDSTDKPHIAASIATEIYDIWSRDDEMAHMYIAEITTTDEKRASIYIDPSRW